MTESYLGDTAWTAVKLVGTTRLRKRIVHTTLERVDGKGWRWTVEWPQMLDILGNRKNGFEPVKSDAEFAIKKIVNELHETLDNAYNRRCYRGKSIDAIEEDALGREAR